MTAIQKLVSISSPALTTKPATVNLSDFEQFGTRGDELLKLLSLKNGFYAFESALHLFPAAPFEQEMTLSRWNSFGLWRHEYGSFAEGKLFFAEDTCGNQFCVENEKIGFFDAETGAVENLAYDLEEWAKRMLSEYEALTSYPLARQWQSQNGPLPLGKRLMLKRPLVLGGDYSLTNLFAVEAVEGMRLRGNIAKQIDGLPEGTQVNFRFTD